MREGIATFFVFLASEFLPVTALILPPQAKLNLSVRALESLVPKLQVANGSVCGVGGGGQTQKRWAVAGKQNGCFEISNCPVLLEGEGAGSDH